MLKKRIIPAMDIENGNVVKCVKFENPRYIGNPCELGKRYAQDGADELIYLDISASLNKRSAMLEWIKAVAKEVNIPFCVVGGIRTIEDIRQILCAGADKIGLNTAAVLNPAIIAEAAKEFGSQCIVVTVDTRKTQKGWEVYTHSGKQSTGLDAVEWVRRVAELGAGEIVHTSIDADGTRNGYDLEFLKIVSSQVNIPVIASGGAGQLEHIYDAFSCANVDGALVASMIHDGEYRIPAIKEYLAKRGIPVRMQKEEAWYIKNYRNLDYVKSYRDREGKTRREIEFIEKIADLKKEDLIVDVCCADGRHLIELAKRGYSNLIGIDLSEVLLKYAQEKADREGANIKFIQRDMRDISGVRPKLITNLFSSFGFFEDDAENFEFFKNAYDALEPGGYFIIDLFLKRYFEGIKRIFEEDDENIILKEEKYTNNQMRLIRKTIVLDKTKAYERSERVSSMREYEGHEILEAITEVGFAIESAYENFKYSPYNEGSKRLVVVARRKE